MWAEDRAEGEPDRWPYWRYKNLMNCLCPLIAPIVWGWLGDKEMKYYVVLPHEKKNS